MESVEYKDHGTFFGIIPDSIAQYSLNDGPLSYEFTLQNLPREDNGSYTAGNWWKILGKAAYGSYRQRATTKLRVNDYDGGSAIEWPINGSNDNQWHHYYCGFLETEPDGRFSQMAYDGVTGKLTFSENGGLYLPVDSTRIAIGEGRMENDYRISVLRIWNKQLPETLITENSKNPGRFEKDNELRGNLIGEWVMNSENYVEDPEFILYSRTNLTKNDHVKNTVVGHIPNSVPGGPDLYFTQKPKFVKNGNTLPLLLSENKVLMENTMVIPQILYWFCGTAGIDSKLCGYPFLKNFALEEQWRKQ